MGMPNYYKILQVQQDADIETITAARRRLLQQHLKDSSPGYMSKVALVNEAHGVLSDPRQRAFYDRVLNAVGEK